MTRNTDLLSRRGFLSRSAFVGCSLAASPLLTPLTMAAAPTDHRLIVIILRGGMDGLDVVQPWGDPDFSTMRPDRPRPGSEKGPNDLDGFFALHPALSGLMPLWAAGELGFAHAVSTPYRDKRSHFDGQDFLEAGTSALQGSRDGWLNRMLQGLPGVETETAFALGRENMLLLNGRAPASNWTPEADLMLSPQALKLAQLVMQNDPQMMDAFAEALTLADSDGDPVMVDGLVPADMANEMRDSMVSARQGNAHQRIAEFAAKRLRGDTRIVGFSLNGWDTHDNQHVALPRALTQLSDTILTLKKEMRGPVWKKTTVIAMTEFGRTVRLNGTRGSDHGTAGAMLLAGGALRGGRVLGDWPGVSEADQYQRRDLMPTRDVRAYAAWTARGLFGIDRSDLEARVFPGLDMGADPGLLL